MPAIATAALSLSTILLSPPGLTATSLDDGWANATDAALSTRGASAGSTSSSYASGAANAAADVAWGAADVTAGAAKLAYGHAVGDEATKQAGREAVWGKTPN